MPPKPKKNLIWFKCDSCSANLLAKEAKNHSSSGCPSNTESWSTPFILSRNIYSNLIIKNVDEFPNMSADVVEHFIFIYDAVINLCNFVIGDPVIIQCENKPSIVRRVYPDKTSSTLNVSAISQSMDPCWRGENHKISIKPFICTPLHAECIYVSCSVNDFLNNSEFKNFVQISQKNKIFSCFNSTYVNFYGKNVILTVLKINEIKSDNWYLITDDTKWIFECFESESKVSQQDVVVGGSDVIINEINSLMDITFRDIVDSINIKLIKCVLLYGTSGVGKTLICNYIANKSSANVISINGSEIFSKFFGETEAALKKKFDEAVKNHPSIILIDEIDTFCSKQSSTSTEQEKRILSTMAILLENLHHNNKRVFVLATTNKLDKLDPTLRRYGRIDYELEVSIPDIQSRLDIMSKLFSTFSHNLTLGDIKNLSHSAHGFVGADIANLCTQATMHAIKNNTDNRPLTLNYSDFEFALNHVKPSAMREVLLDIPNVKWSDIGGQDDLKLKLKQAIEWPLKHSASFTRLGIKPPSGVLMFGPPGCSKTMIAKALATESELNFLSIKGPELFSKWVGESERAVREVFRKARQVAPSIVFFDEIDALGGERSSDGNGSRVQERVLAQILTELDGISPLGNVTIVAATNRPDKMDSALLRPGRLDRIVYVPLPDIETRRSIFKIKLAKMSLAADVHIENLVSVTDGYSGAEIEAVCHEAALKALEEDIDCLEVISRHFDVALQSVKPRTPPNLIQLYENFLKSHLQ